MKCPVCGSVISDGLTCCPVCHVDLKPARSASCREDRYCPACGALIPEKARWCARCGMVAPQSTQGSKTIGKLSFEQNVDDLTGIENEKPYFHNAVSPKEKTLNEIYDQEGIPNKRVIILAALASIFLIGALAILLAHPWDPNFFVDRTPVVSEKNTATTVDRLKRQDFYTSVPHEASHENSD